jgi:superfamily I DNA/RNA helicase
MIDVHDLQTPITHDAYFKAWALAGAPGLESLADRYLIDEAQDNNCVADLLFSRLSKPVVYVGDPNQSIYGFRGAVDSLSSFCADESLALTTSFRFGPHIASLANALLAHFKINPLRIVGCGVHDAVCDVQSDLPFTVIARTNAGVFSCASAMLDAGHHISLVGGVEAYSLGRLLDLFNTANGKPRVVADPLIRSLGSIDAVQSYAKLTADHELKAAIRVVKQAGSDLPSLVARIRTASIQAYSAHRTSVTLCTAHKAKGLEFSQVLMADDFPTIYLPDGNLVSPARADQQEVNLLYVALTRACAILRPTDSLLRLLNCSAQRPATPIVKPALPAIA